jgi:thiamine-phosphate pyrophosphorylase
LSAAHSRPRIGFRLLAISSGLAHCGRRERSALVAWLQQMAIHAGAAAIQIREKGLDDRATYELCLEAREIFAGPLLLNGRADLALAAGVYGVHLPGDGPPTEAIAARFGGSLIVGRSTHRLEEILGRLDYVCLGPAFATPSKPGAPPIGLDRYAEAARVGPVVFALGGIDDASAARAALRAGAHGVAGIRLFEDPRRIPALLDELPELGG